MLTVSDVKAVAYGFNKEITWREFQVWGAVGLQGNYSCEQWLILKPWLQGFSKEITWREFRWWTNSHLYHDFVCVTIYFRYVWTKGLRYIDTFEVKYVPQI